MVVVLAVVVAVANVVLRADAIDDEDGDERQQIFFADDVLVVPVVLVELSTTYPWQLAKR
jgi:hypothetical protein